MSVSGWTQVPGSRIWKASVSTKGFRQLYVNNQRKQRARSNAKIAGLGWYVGGTGRKDGIYVESGDVGLFENASDMEVHMPVEWRDYYLPVESLSSAGSDRTLVKMKQPNFNTALTLGGPVPRYDIPFYMENAYELLDEPGEWYCNQTTNTLYYWPEDTENMSTAEVYVPVLTRFLEIVSSSLSDKVHNIQFEGITFEHAGWTAPNGQGWYGWQAESLAAPQVPNSITPASIHFDAARDVRFRRNKIRHVGAVAMGLYNGISNVEVTGNTFTDISDAAITIGRPDHNYNTLGKEACKNISVRNNLIHRTGRDFWGAPAITAFYVEALDASHNDISDVPYSGISVGWGWNAYPDSTTSKNNTISN